MNTRFPIGRAVLRACVCSLLFFLPGYAAAGRGVEFPRQIDLQGRWAFSLVSGEAEGDSVPEVFPDTVFLPGTTDTNRKGYPLQNREETTFLSRLHSYVGKAWYRRKVSVPKDWRGKDIRFVMERTKPTHVYVDGKFVGQSDDIQTAQVYDLSEYLSPGEHEIAVLVDNGQSVPPQVIASSHAYSESTQTNWNGIIGRIALEAREQLHISDVQVYPDVASRSVWVRVSLASPHLVRRGMRVSLNAEAWNTSVPHRAGKLELPLSPSQGEYLWQYALGDEAQLWSEFHPALYRLTVKLEGGDERTVDFGLRQFSVCGTQFAVNGHKTFLRGKHDGCVFPLTGHTAMDVETWRRYFRTAKSYGINHYRFHSWCPPEACFEAADAEGVYLQPELPYWGYIDARDGRLLAFLEKEGRNILKAYANHPSFVMFALGNELSGSQDALTALVKKFARQDTRPLYAYGSNNYLGFQGHVQGEDYLTTCRIGGEQPNTLATHTRASFSFADAYDGGYLNHTYPNTVMDFSAAIGSCPVPVISHETGQYQMYPDYRALPKYTGALYPCNMEVFRRRLEQAGMAAQAGDFFRASGAWAVELYKADIEMELRTPGLGGFQLLDPQDYPGQGSAYIGVLDAFMDSKGLVAPERWRGFCSEVVPLALMEKYCWTTGEQFEAQVKIANYSEHSLSGRELLWQLADGDGRQVAGGSLPIAEEETGLLDAGSVAASLSSLAQAQRLTLSLHIPGTTYRNAYSLWVYPQASSAAAQDSGVLVTRDLSPEVMDKLKAGARVLWFPRREALEEQTVGGLFTTDYWNYRMFKTISENNKRPVSPGTLGLLIDERHPALADFPTEYHTDWQWFSIAKQSYPLILDRFPAALRPIVQTIDNVERNHRLGLLFEVAVGQGSLLVCMADLEPVRDRPEVRQFLFSLRRYMQSGVFRPSLRMEPDELIRLLRAKAEGGKIEELGNISYD